MLSPARSTTARPSPNGSAGPSKSRPTAVRRELSVHTPWTQSATLRSDWTPKRVELAIGYGQTVLTCDLQAESKSILCGAWQTELVVGGERLNGTSAWEPICWELNADAAYFELELELEAGAVIQRQIFLARKDRFVLLADALRLPQASAGELRTTWHLPAALEPESTADMHETFLRDGRKRLASALPVSLPEWRREGGGRFQVEGQRLEHAQSFRGRGTHAALFIDLDAGRTRKPLTWRRLTIGESRQIVSADNAAGYRVQIGKQQWLIYRSLSPACNRTVLGQNYSTEFVVARFQSNGLADKLLEIQPD